MPCDSISVRYAVKIANLDKNTLVEALKLMDWVKSVVIVGDTVEVTLKDGTKTVGVMTKNQVVFDYRGAALNTELVKYYGATVQALTLKKQNFQVNISKQGDLLRVKARR